MQCIRKILPITALLRSANFDSMRHTANRRGRVQLKTQKNTAPYNNLSCCIRHHVVKDKPLKKKATRSMTAPHLSKRRPCQVTRVLHDLISDINESTDQPWHCCNKVRTLPWTCKASLVAIMYNVQNSSLPGLRAHVRPRRLPRSTAGVSTVRRSCRLEASNAIRLVPASLMMMMFSAAPGKFDTRQRS